jgi:Aspartate-semialdehyde dehydrogenase
MNYVPIAIGSGCIVIDNSSTYRMDKNVPLCVPEINATSLYGKNLIANPNCSSIIASLPLFCLDRIFGLKKAYISTYQAVSGAGTMQLRI